MITQTLAIFLDAYRQLRAKKLFWIAMIISLLVVGAFGMLGVSKDGLSFFRWTSPLPSGEAMVMYKEIFSFWLLGIWMSWGAVILALISTAGIFPDLLAGGSIDLYLARPISRLRLFATKYAAGLLFVAMQTTVFAAAAVLCVRLRAGVWIPGLLWAVPVLVCFYSYLFSVCVLVGVWTRSTLIALLMTILVWAAIATVNWAELATLDLVINETVTRMQLDMLGRQGEEVKRTIEPMTQFAKSVHPWLYRVKTALPKTAETANLVDRSVFSRGEEVLQREMAGNARGYSSRSAYAEELRKAAEAHTNARRGRSLWWIVGTSLIFEAVVLALAAWRFCRRDY